MKLDLFTQAYIECALWSTTDNSNESGGEPLDHNYDVGDIALPTLNQMIADCKQFQADHFDDIVEDLERAGHDFWLTRNHHGAGFWDGDWDKEVGKQLTEASHAWGEVDLYVGDDGLIY